MTVHTQDRAGSLSSGVDVRTSPGRVSRSAVMPGRRNSASKSARTFGWEEARGETAGRDLCDWILKGLE